MSQYYAAASIGGAGTANTIPKFISATSLGNSGITDTGSAMTFGSSAYNTSGYTFGGTGPVVFGGEINVGAAPILNAAALVNMAFNGPNNLYQRGPNTFYTSSGAAGGGFNSFKSRGTITSPTIVVNGDFLGTNTFGGYDGSNWNSLAAIAGLVDGTVSPGVIPTDIVFLTTTTNEGALTNRWRILSGGHFVPEVNNTYNVGSHALLVAGASIVALNDVSTINATNGGAVTFGAGIIAASLTVSSGTTLIASSAAFTNNAAAAVGTLTNAPAAGNPTKWIPINDNGTIRNIPAW
jgi:hypothetical protein